MVTDGANGDMNFNRLENPNIRKNFLKSDCASGRAKIHNLSPFFVLSISRNTKGFYIAD